MIRVLFIHNEQLYYEGVQAVLEKTDDIRLVGLAMTKEETIQKMEQQPADVALIHMHLPSINGIQLVIYLKEHYPNIKCILLTNYSDRDLVVAGVLAGADGFLLTNATGNNIIRAIRDVLDEEIVFSGEAAKVLADKIMHYAYSEKEILRKRLENRNLHLTDREIDIACLLMKWKTNLEIAEELKLSEGTIKNYVSELYSRFQIHNRKKLITYLRTLCALDEVDTLTTIKNQQEKVTQS